MNSIHLVFRTVTLLSALVLILGSVAPVYSQDNVADGRIVYEKYCIGCHGDKGDGKGTVAGDLTIKPRDFTTGMYKFTTTTNSLPTSDDLKYTIRNGLPPSSMPSFRLLPEMEANAVVDYLISLSDRWDSEKPRVKFTRTGVPGFVGTSASVSKGKELFDANCAMCHGTKSGRPNVTFAMRWNGTDCNKDSVKPANFNNRVIKRGPTVEDIYMSVTSGVKGTPMIPFGNVINEEDRWHLTSYVLDFMGMLRR